MKCLWLLLLYCFSWGVHPAQERLLMSYTDDSIVTNQYIPILQHAYTQLGIDVEWVKVSIKRGIEGVDSGTFDGDVARLEHVNQYFSNVILVPPAFEVLTIKLFCRRNYPCDKSLFSNAQLVVGLPSNSPVIMPLLPKYDFKPQNVNGLTQIEKMFTFKRFDYFIWVESSIERQNFLTQFESNSISLEEIKVFHVLNKSQSHLLPALSKQLALSQQKLLISK